MDAEGFETALDEGYRLEQQLRWTDAEAFYERLSKEATLTRGQGADVRLRRANTLMQQRRWDEAQREFDEALAAAKTANDPLVLARALLGAGVFAATRNDLSRGEDFLLAGLEAFHRAHGDEGLSGEGWALANLGAIYGRTRRLDLAFLTFDKARERLFKVEDWIGVATAWELQAQLRETLGDNARAAEDLHEAMSFYAKQGMSEKVEEIRRRLGGNRVV